MHDDSISALERWFVAAALHYVTKLKHGSFVGASLAEARLRAGEGVEGRCREVGTHAQMSCRVGRRGLGERRRHPCFSEVSGARVGSTHERSRGRSE